MLGSHNRRLSGGTSRLETTRRSAFGTWTVSFALLASGCSVYYLPEADPDAGAAGGAVGPAATGAGGASSGTAGMVGATGTAVTTGAGGTPSATSAGSGTSTGGALGTSGTGSSGSGGAGEDAAAGAGGAMDPDASSGASSGSGSGGASGAGGASGTGGAGAGGTGGTGNRADAGVIITVDDSVIGIGLNQINYVGSWQHCKPCTSPSTPPLYMVSNSWVASEDAAGPNLFTFDFKGTSVALYGVVDPRHGIGAIAVDEGPETTIDFYQPVRHGDHAVWSSPDLPSGPHVLHFRLTGTKNASSSGAGLGIDRIDVRE